MKVIVWHMMEEVPSLCGVPQETINWYIEQEWIHPFDAQEGLLDDEDVARIKLIHELMQDLGINEEAVPVVLHLIDQINSLHIRIRNLE